MKIGERFDVYWCPSSNHVDDVSFEWSGNHTRPETFGSCNHAYSPPANGCPDHYEPVGLHIIITLLFDLLILL